VLVRVDDRLLHGQVAIGWAGALDSKLILVANDEVAGDGWLRALYSEAAPPGVSVRICTLTEAPAQMNSVAAGSKAAIVVVKIPADLVALYEMGARFEEVNIGGMHYEKGKRELLPYMYVGDNDVRALRRLLDWGVNVNAQDVPGGKCYDVRSLLEELA
jgi:mannose/fructose/N-acetylgalactosamine-specific phosphotransferase system component IIB